MSNGEPSQTALTAAAARAAHLIVDNEPMIFRDTLAYTLLGDQAEEFIGFHRAHGAHVVLAGARAAVTTRSRFTEDRVAEGVRHGITQYVILGAGLDSFAYRSEPAIRVFEVDHPATQQWKRGLLADAGIVIPRTLAFVPADLETESPRDSLIRAGFDPSQPALVSWLGVTMYLTPKAIGRTLAVIGGFAPRTEIVVDHMVPEDLRDADGQTYADLVMPVAAEHGEPWLTFFSPQSMSSLLAEHGFDVIEQARQHDAIDATLWDRSDPLRAFDVAVLTHAVNHGF